MIVTLTSDTPARRAALATAVDAERDRRQALGFAFEGAAFQARTLDLININGAASAATIALGAGAAAGDPRWHGGAADFAWIAADNALVAMDAPTVVRFALAAMATIERLVMTARALKDRAAAGETFDPADDALWPG